MDEFHSLWTQFAQPERFATLLRALALLAGGLVLGKLLAAFVARVMKGQLQAQSAMLLRRGVFYSVFSLGTVEAMYEMGFKIDALMGAAGIFSVAIGFASQTSMSNLISGLFLIGERAFLVGDVVEIGKTIGEVLSIDLLSVKLRTFDNLYVRIPNEHLIKAEVKNLSRFPIRRYDLRLEVAAQTNLDKLQEILEEVADQNPLCLDEPAVQVALVGYGQQSIEVALKTWSTNENYLAFKTSILRDVKTAFETHGIALPLPHRVLHMASNGSNLLLERASQSEPDPS